MNRDSKRERGRNTYVFLHGGISVSDKRVTKRGDHWIEETSDRETSKLTSIENLSEEGNERE